ncbi:cation-translocating P-type ATPase [Chloroflexota bacterium]
MAGETQWYQLSREETFKQLGSSEVGLTSTEAQARLERYGYNELKFKKQGALIRFLLQFHNPLVYVLLAASVLTAILGIWSDTAVILGVVILNVIIGFIQEGKGEAAIEALKKMMIPECVVLRDGQEKCISARELVPGDVVLLEGGDGVPGDLRLFGAKNLRADESMLTGESVPAGKGGSHIPKPNLSPGEQRCIAFSGTFITQGRGLGIVVSTGEHTEFGKIARLMKETRKITTPLMRKIADFTKILIIGILALAALNLILSIIFQYDLIYAFLASVALAVAAIPEMLPAVVSAILALAAVAMAKRHALIRKLPAAETLGCTTVICSDKTGTLTKNQMTVVSIYCGGEDYRVSGAGYEPVGEFLLNNKRIDSTQEHRELTETLRGGYLCNNASLVTIESGYNILGDPTEGALVVSARKAGIDEKPPRLDEIPFESEQQYMATMYGDEETNIIYVKGSPERVLQMCQSQLIDGSIGTLESERISGKAAEMAKDALRVLGMAYKTVPKDKDTLDSEDLEGLIFLGLQGMIDPPREEVIEAVEQCKKAGVRTVMITGDHALTARAIALQLGISSNGDKVLTGEELSSMSDDDLYQVVDEVSVYARVAPEHKLRITQQLQRRGHVTAVTGDGVNDAPALKAADIGIAMGISGTEVSKQAADMVLTDDNFASIVGAVEEGRHVWKNLQKAILYTLPTNGGQALLVMGAVLLAPFIALFALRLPLEPIHILWVNLADSVFLTLPLMMEPKEKGLLGSPPRDAKEKIANRLFWERVGILSVVMALVGFAIYYYYGVTALSGPAVDELRITQAQTAAFMGVKLLHIGFLVSARSIMRSAFTFNPFSNKWVLLGIAITIITQLMITYIPPIQVVFRTAAFPAEWWPIIILSIFPGFIFLEVEKFLRRHLGKTET